MTTLNAKANAAYHALVDEYEREHPDSVWIGFDHERDAYEQGWEDGHEARPVVDREALCQVIAEAIDDLDGVPPMGPPAEHLERRTVHVADAVLALINGSES